MLDMILNSHASSSCDCLFVHFKKIIRDVWTLKLLNVPFLYSIWCNVSHPSGKAGKTSIHLSDVKVKCEKAGELS